MFVFTEGRHWVYNVTIYPLKNTMALLNTNSFFKHKIVLNMV